MLRASLHTITYLLGTMKNKKNCCPMLIWIIRVWQRMTLLLRIGKESLNINCSLTNIILRLLPCLLLLCLTCLQNLTSFRGRLFKPIGTLHQPRSRSHKMSLQDYLFILGIQRRLPASGSRSLLHHSTTPASPTDIRQAIPGIRPT